MTTNSLKTFILLGLLTAIILWVGNAVGGQGGLVIALLIALVMNVGSYWFSDKIVLAAYRGREVSPEEAPELHEMVGRLARRAGLPMPRVYIIPSQTPNAFATGRNPEHAAVAFTEGILRLLSREELEGVAAHELAHIRNRDILISTVAATLAGAITYLAYMAQWAAIFGGGRDDDREGGMGGALGMLAFAILGPIAAMLLQAAISRAREYMADARGAQIAGTPRGLAGALGRLERAARAIPMEEATPATAHLFIVNPLTGGGMLALFSTHPPTEERIRRLREMT
ncbi:MAG: zinc metalloprotease HtpX [Nitrospinota bacterium]